MPCALHNLIIWPDKRNPRQVLIRRKLRQHFVIECSDWLREFSEQYDLTGQLMHKIQ